MPLNELQFIVSLPHSTHAAGSSQQKIARSHAARSAHARERRLRTQRFQAQKAREGPDQLERPSSLLLRPKDDLGSCAISFLPADRRDPFASFVVPLKPMEQMLFDHYVTTVVPLMRCNLLDAAFTERMTTGWVPLAVTQEILLQIMFLASCRHLADRYGDRPENRIFSRLAFQYKLRVLQSLRGAISTEAPGFSDSTVSTAIMLAYDEIFIQDRTMLRHHAEGAVQMVALKGGPQMLGLNGLLARLLSNLLRKVSMEVGVVVRIPWDN
ncbi:uncharacterized protein BJX67DRAFT_147816 [Aspergillus lucknowensis]|uniref:Transcription factor domain-containing protein n=1 Tax=Aspergillus lucknowensis TaxID=176173 RepID=A0ABR4LNV0_9EURO